MKKTIFTLAIGLTTTVLSFAQSSYSIEPIMKIGYTIVDAVEKKFDNKAIITKAEFDFAYDDNLSYVDLSKGVNYIISGFGDENIADVSLIIMKKVDGKWSVVAKDSENASSATLEVPGQEGGEYAIDVKVNKFKGDKKVGHIGFLILAMAAN